MFSEGTARRAAEAVAVGGGTAGVAFGLGRVVDLDAVLDQITIAEDLLAVTAERAFSRALGGSCQVPLGGYALREGAGLYLRGFLATPDGARMVRGEARGSPDDAEAMGRDLAARLRAEGGEAILAALACAAAPTGGA